jgi:hypothetical protein
MRLPDPRPLASEFAEHGFVRVSGVFDDQSLANLFDLAVTLLRQHAVEVDRDYSDVPGQGLHYSVVTGERIKADGELLFNVYCCHEMLTWLQAVTNAPEIRLSPHLRSAININCLSHVGQQYPWHQDAVRYTSLLFLSSVAPSAGGELLIRDGEGQLASIRPIAGHFVVMDGTRCPHAVAALSEETLRVSVPMVYPAENLNRPEGLDTYLYRGTSSIQRTSSDSCSGATPTPRRRVS